MPPLPRLLLLLLPPSDAATVKLRGRRLAVCAGSLILGLLAALAAGGAYVSMKHPAPLGVWQSLGAATGVRQDAGPVDFASLERRNTPNDALVCPQDLCATRADVTPPVFTISADRLMAKVRAVVLAEARTEELPAPAPNRLRFVQRSRLMRFPDIVDVQIVPRSSGASTLALYSRSVVGRSDFGVNRARLIRWLDLLAQ